jgi:hypothetical protein
MKRSRRTVELTQLYATPYTPGLDKMRAPDQSGMAEMRFSIVAPHQFMQNS